MGKIEFLHSLIQLLLFYIQGVWCDVDFIQSKISLTDSSLLWSKCL